MMCRSQKKAFTLIELLVVVAVIAILAAIAVPNFLEAQTRSKISRARADERSLATALESYRVDFNHYPPASTDGKTRTLVITRFARLTTPQAYMSGIPTDPFLTGNLADVPQLWGGPVYDYFEREQTELWPGMYKWGPAAVEQNARWFVNSFGPDRKGNNIVIQAPDGPFSSYTLYDPTNGTISDGDLLRFGP
jgi:type II secretion system protein G